MKLYPKNLRDIKSLEQEKARLIRKKGKLEQNNIIISGTLSLVGKKGGKKKNDESAGSGDELLALAGPLIQIARDIVIGRLTQKSDPAEKEIKDTASSKKKKSIPKRIALEFIGGYLKWKAVELGFKAITMLIKARANKKSVTK